MAAYLDDEFRALAIREVYDQHSRMVAPSYGFRLFPVLVHCLRARRASLIRDGALVGVVAVGALIWFPSTLLAFTPILLLALFRAFNRRVVLGFTAVFVLLICLSMLPLTMLRSVLAGVGSGPTPSSTEYEEHEPPFALPDSTLTVVGAMFILLLLVGITAADRIWRLHNLVQLAPEGTVIDPHPPDSYQQVARFGQISRQQRGNTVGYAGYRPFIGAGEVIDTWGFAQRLIRADDGIVPRNERDREFTQAPFSAEELVDHLKAELGRIASDPAPERRLPGLVVMDRIYLSDADTRRLTPHTDVDEVSRIIRHPTSKARHYLACQVVSWDGEIVTTVHVHVAVQGRTLYLELTTTSLLPCRDDYQVFDDRTGPLAADDYLRATAQAVTHLGSMVLKAPLRLLQDLMIRIEARSRGTGNQLMYGARISLREEASSGMIHSHIQEQDILKYKRIIERRVLAAVFDFLNAHHVDTSEYQERALTVLNAGAINFGSGSITVDTAIGQQNQVAPSPKKPHQQEPPQRKSRTK